MRLSRTLALSVAHHISTIRAAVPAIRRAGSLPPGSDLPDTDAAIISRAVRARIAVDSLVDSTGDPEMDAALIRLDDALEGCEGVLRWLPEEAMEAARGPTGWARGWWQTE